MDNPHNHGYKDLVPAFNFDALSEETLEMLKVAFCAVLASWMTAALMAIVYSREIAQFIVERSQ